MGPVLGLGSYDEFFDYEKCIWRAFIESMLEGEMAALSNLRQMRVYCLEEMGEFSTEVNFESLFSGLFVQNFERDGAILAPGVLSTDY